MHAVAALSWDPQLRGALIVLTAVGVLVGSVYLLLATNMGARLGFVLAAAGLSGLLVLINILWLSFGIGYKGVLPGWTVKEIVTGDLVAHSTTPAVVGTPSKPSSQFPNGWRYLPAGTPLLASASPAADTALIPPAVGAVATSSFPAPFKTTQDYLDIGGWTKGGRNYLLNLFGYKIFWRIRNHTMFIKHQPHFVVIRVQPALPTVTLLGEATTLPAADLSKPMTSVVLERNVGSLRLPPMLIGLSALIVFAVATERLHSRDKMLARRRAEEGTTSRELQPA